jgi:hypothetical protein
VLCVCTLCGTAKEKIINILDEAAGGQLEGLKVLLESLSKEMGTISESLWQDGPG